MALLTTIQVCEILGISKNNLNQITFRKNLRWAEKRGKFVYYKQEDVEAYKAKRDKRKKTTPTE